MGEKRRDNLCFASGDEFRAYADAKQAEINAKRMRIRAERR